MVTNLDHLNLSVADFQKTVDWYGQIFGFELVESGTYNGNPWGVIRSGDAMLCIYEHTSRKFRDGDFLQRENIHGINHFALKITNRKQWEKTVEREQLRIHYGGPITWPHSTSWYITDPTGYEIEVALWHEGNPQFA